ncbi:MAG: tetratricopeptide repeat protein [Acidobacteriota bacterium]|nr:tetratricopeptide repeat protein [Acidobacteriota bacterium]
MSTQPNARITVHIVEDFAPDTAWVHTHGMAQFGCPDLEWYWSPASSCREAGRLLNRIAARLAGAGRAPRPGDIVEVPGEAFAVRLGEPFEHEDGDYDGNSVLRVSRLTTGADGVNAFRDLLAAGGSPSEFHHRRAVSLHLQDNFIDAWLEYEKALQANPRNIYALTNVGYLLLHHGDIEGALPFLRRASEIAPDYALPHNSLGNAYFSLGKTDEALAEYRMAVELDAGYAMPHRNLALVNYLTGRREEAIEEYGAYFRLAPADTRDAGAHYNLGVVLEELGRVGEAAGEYEKALADDPGHARALNNLGLVLLRRGDCEGAARRFERALEADGSFALARYNLGLCRAALGDYAGAAEEFERACEADPGNVHAASNLGVAYTTVGRFDEAVELFEGLVAKYEGQPTLHFNLGMAYAGKGLGRAAAEQFRKVVELEPAASARALRAGLELKALEEAEGVAV